jgi:DNA-binding transcriptional ArsR family regulator
VARTTAAIIDSGFEALANDHRRAILRILSLQPCSISWLAAARGLSLPAIHKHIGILEKAGLVNRRKIGRTNFLALNRRSLRRLQDWLSEFHTYWGTDKETLENYARYLEQSP